LKDYFYFYKSQNKNGATQGIKVDINHTMIYNKWVRFELNLTKKYTHYVTKLKYQRLAREKYTQIKTLENADNYLVSKNYFKCIVCQLNKIYRIKIVIATICVNNTNRLNLQESYPLIKALENVDS
jgi:hypothetical protein